jgi:hypothetical protein
MSVFFGVANTPLKTAVGYGAYNNGLARLGIGCKRPKPLEITGSALPRLISPRR